MEITEHFQAYLHPHLGSTLNCKWYIAYQILTRSLLGSCRRPITGIFLLPRGDGLGRSSEWQWFKSFTTRYFYSLECIRYRAVFGEYVNLVASATVVLLLNENNSNLSHFDTSMASSVLDIELCLENMLILLLLLLQLYCCWMRTIQIFHTLTLLWPPVY